MKITLGPFKGIAPKIEPRYLPDTGAQTAENCKLLSGALRSWKSLLAVAADLVAGTKTSMYLYESLFWLAWVNKTVNVCKSPVAGDTYKRLYWTGDGAPKMSTYDKITTGSTVYPNGFFPLGIPAPDTALTASINSDWSIGALPLAATWASVTYGNSLFVTVASGTSTAATSADGVTWTTRTLPLVSNWSAVAYGAGLFVAMSGSVADKLATSPDGITWTQRTLPIAAPISAVVFGNGVFVAVTLGDKAFTSPDGITWTQRTMPATSSWVSVVYGNGVFLAIVQNDTIIATSPDGITWTQRTLPIAATWKDVAFGNNRFVAISQNSTIIATSPDGITWNEYVTTFHNWQAIAYGAGFFVAISLDANLATSIDGQTWEPRTIGTASPWSRITFGGDRFVAVTFGAAVGGMMPAIIDTTAEPRSYVYRYRSTYGESGPPSPASTVTNVYYGQTAALSGIGPATYSAAATYGVGAVVVHSGSAYQCIVAITIAEAWNASKWQLLALDRIEIFRTNTGSATTTYQYVGVVTLGTTTYTDAVASTDLGDVLESLLWDLPPSDLAGLIALPNGSFAGYSGKELCLSVPYQPHAWPIEFRYPVADTIMGIGSYGKSIMIATQGAPYVATLNDAGGVFPPERLENGYACISTKGVVDMGDAVAYPTPFGLMTVGVNGMPLSTGNVLGKDEWQALSPTSLVGYYYGGMYFGFSSTAAFTFNPATGDLATLAGVTPTAGYHDPTDGSLYLMVGGSIYKWDAGASHLASVWKSKPFISERPVNLGCARVRANSYPVTFKLYADGALKLTATVSNAKPFKLPAKYLAYEFTVELSGATGFDVYEVVVAESTRDLR